MKISRDDTSKSELTRFRSVNVADLRVGGVINHAIYDEHRVLLIAPGTTLTESFLEHLLHRGISRILVHEDDLPRVFAGKPQGEAFEAPDRHRGSITWTKEENPVSRELDRGLQEWDAFACPPEGLPFSAEFATPDRVAYDPKLQSEFVENQEANVKRVEQVFANLLGGRGLDIVSLAQVADEALQDLSSDSDIFASLGLNPFGTNYPARHCLHTSMLALSIGVNLQLDKLTLKELAIGCLIHDAGMLRINTRLAELARPLTPVEFLEITKHPVKVFDFVRSLEQIPRRSAFIAYQVHERIDGSGYPRGRTGNQIRFLSKVAAVADMYAALVAPRPHRPALMPARALDIIIKEGSAGRLAADAVRALTEATSLFPIGSYVRLSDGRVGQTIRSNGKEFDRPVVEAWPVGRLNQPPEVIDLVTRPDVYIADAIPRLSMTQAELSKSEDRPTSVELNLANLLNLAARPLPEGEIDRRASKRAPFIGRLSVFLGEDQGTHSRKVQARNLSRQGIAFIDNFDAYSDYVVIVLEREGISPIFLRARIVRRAEVRSGWWEYGLCFESRAVDPTTVLHREKELAGAH